MSINAAELQLYTEHRGIDVPLLDHLQFRFKPIDSDDPRAGNLVIQIEPYHLNGWQNAHGGVIMTLLDVAMALNASRLDEEKRGCVTVEMKSNFLKPGGNIGEILEAIGSVRHSTYSLAFCEAELRNGKGELIATASGTFKYINKARPKGRT
ncbi:PaaI family thioesterase [Pseudomonas cavernae]|uniref:PaaI family thioesterase n=1 Tax=Pseudomonas cavernae TaxID=2320867 RepID=A0A385Z5Y1_9PSED|nr:PaaI family thioesterase [Pseudomonas cavernae]AYC34101.1 PaaI family thioesterase [Pseudomonas cavernae]